MNTATAIIPIKWEVLTDEQIATRLSSAQKKTLEVLKREIWRHDTYSSQAPTTWNEGLYEVKRWEVKAASGNNSPLVFLYSVIGRRGDEGTYAEVYARNKRHIAIGVRGGCRLLNAAHFVTIKGKTVRKASKSKPQGIYDCSRLPTD